MKDKIILILLMLLFTLSGLCQSQSISIDGRTFIVTETINLSNNSSFYLDSYSLNRFDGVYEINQEMKVYGDITGKFVSDFSVSGMRNALERCKANNYSFFDLPDGAMIIDEFNNDSVFSIDMDNVYFNGQGYTYTEKIVIELPEPFNKLLKRDNIIYHITKRSDEDTVFLVVGCYDNSVIFNVSGSNCRVSGIKIKFLHINDSLTVFGLFSSDEDHIKYNHFDDIWIDNSAKTMQK